MALCEEDVNTMPGSVVTRWHCAEELNTMLGSVVTGGTVRSGFEPEIGSLLLSIILRVNNF